MKKFTKLLGIVLIMALVMSMGTMALADEPYGAQNQDHTITVTSNGTGVHNYEAYQVFKGNLDAAEGVLSDIQWGSGINSAGLLDALEKANANSNSALFGQLGTITAGDAAADPAVPASTAAEVAKVLEGKNASFMEAFADLVSANLTGTKAGTGATDGKTPNKGEISVNGDGYYFIKDTTSALANGDTSSKFMLQVVKDLDITAKDTVLTPDKEILKANGENFDRVKENTAAVGDTVTFEVTIPVPDTTAYKDHFIFNMNDQLPAGLTFTGVSSVKIGDNTLTSTGANPNYTVTAKTSPATTYSAYTIPEDPVTAVGGQAIKIVFNNFKAYVEADQDTSTEGVQNLIGQSVVITYTAVVNDDAVFGSTGNENEVQFIYSNDPNHDYDGDEPDSDDTTGETPKDHTKTFVAGIEILKVDGSDTTKTLAGAEFEITSTSYTKTVTKGTKFEPANYVKTADETIESGTYYKLKDGSYTTTNPSTLTNKTQYEGSEPYPTYVKVSWNKTVTTPDANNKITYVTGSDGIIDIKGLKPGTYTIKETHSPDGYNKIDDEITIVIDWDPTTPVEGAADKAATFKLGTGTTTGVSLIADGESANAIYKIQIENNSGTVLPSTGGIGTTIFYVVGSIMVVAAGVLLITKKRMSREG